MNTLNLCSILSNLWKIYTYFLKTICKKKYKKHNIQHNLPSLSINRDIAGIIKKRNVAKKQNSFILNHSLFIF